MSSTPKLLVNHKLLGRAEANRQERLDIYVGSNNRNLDLIF